MQLLKNPYRSMGITPSEGMADKQLSVNAERVQSLLQHCPAAKQTPLLNHSQMATELGVAKLWIKDERERMGLGSFKATGAAYVIAVHASEAMADQNINLKNAKPEQLKQALKGVTYVCASAGNHGLSVAAGARVFGANAIIYLSHHVPESFAERLRSYDAQVIRVGDNYAIGLEAAKSAAEEHGWILLADTTWPGYTDLPLLLMEGYLAVAAEIVAQCPEIPTHIILHAGVGGIAGAVCAYLRAQWGETPNVIIVEPESAPALMESIRVGKPIVTEGPSSNMGRLDCKEPSHVSLKQLAKEADWFVTISDKQAQQTVDWLKDSYDFLATPSAVASLSAMHHSQNGDALRSSLGIDANSTVLHIVTEQQA